MNQRLKSEPAFIIYRDVKNPEFIDESRERIGCSVIFPKLQSDPVSFVAFKHDVADHGKKMYQELMAGKYGPIAPYNPKVDESKLLSRRAFLRRESIEETQWIVDRHRDQYELKLPTSISATQYSQLQTYRQALRDWPDKPTWPATAPSKPDWLQDVLNGKQKREAWN